MNLNFILYGLLDAKRIGTEVCHLKAPAVSEVNQIRALLLTWSADFLKASQNGELGASWTIGFGSPLPCSRGIFLPPFFFFAK